MPERRKLQVAVAYIALVLIAAPLHAADGAKTIELPDRYSQLAWAGGGRYVAAGVSVA